RTQHRASRRYSSCFLRWVMCLSSASSAATSSAEAGFELSAVAFARSATAALSSVITSDCMRLRTPSCISRKLPKKSCSMSPRRNAVTLPSRPSAMRSKYIEHRGAYCTTGLGAMLAIAELAVIRDRRDVVERGVVGIVDPLRELAHARRVDPQT